MNLDQTDGPPPSGARPAPDGLSWWAEKRFRRATRSDSLFALGLTLLATLALWTGRRSTDHLTPAGAHNLVPLLAALQLPSRLPDAPLRDEDGGAISLLARTGTRRAVITFYAPWCGPCQQELPELVRQLSPTTIPLLVVVGQEEDRRKTRRQLDNLGLSDTRFLVDATGDLQRGGRVSGFPTTFVIGSRGEVIERFEGASWALFYYLQERLRIPRRAT